MTALLSCPFCGGEADVVIGAVEFDDAEIHCNVCGVAGGNFHEAKTPEENCVAAITAWNRRAPSDAYRAGAEAMRERAAEVAQHGAREGPHIVDHRPHVVAAAIRALPLPLPEEPTP